MTSHDALDLKFGPTTSPTGFTPAGIAMFSDLRPAAVVRELVQNSLDAAMEAKQRSAIVRFHLTKRKTKDIPGIESYRASFHAAVNSQMESKGSLSIQAQRVIRIIDETLKKDECDVLSVLDNGVGLNKESMTALLSDGVSFKEGHSTGTFGNGHSVVIPASDLRYILYGGVAKDRMRIGAGHAVLASRVEPGKIHQKAGDGFLIRNFQSGGYVFARNSQIPAFISDEIDEIVEDSGQGAAVIIPAFNHFRENDSLWNMVSKAVSCNFLQAIEDDRLDVWVRDSRPGKSEQYQPLDRKTLKSVLETHKDEKRTRSFLSGLRAFEAHRALRYGKHYKISTCCGNLDLRILRKNEGNSRIDLFRNGMWITDHMNISAFRGKFSDREPFHALMMLNHTNAERLHELVRNAEGPLHDKLDIKQRLSPSHARDLRKAFKEIVEWLRENVPEVSGDTYSPDDFLTLDFGDEGNTETGKTRRSFWGEPVALDQRDPGLSQYTSDGAGGGSSGGSGGGRKGGGRGSRPRSQRIRRPFFQVASVPAGSRRRRIHVECQRKCDNAELRLFVDENVDVTCDRPRRDEVSPVSLGGVRIDGRDILDDRLVREDGQVVGVRLGDLTENSSVRIDAEYQLPEHVSDLVKQSHVLRVEVFRTAPAVEPEPQDE